MMSTMRKGQCLPQICQFYGSTGSYEPACRHMIGLVMIARRRYLSGV